MEGTSLREFGPCAFPLSSLSEEGYDGIMQLIPLDVGNLYRYRIYLHSNKLKTGSPKETLFSLVPCQCAGRIVATALPPSLEADRTAL